jgi:hypothetical protein
MIKKHTFFCAFIVSTVWIMTCNNSIAGTTRTKTPWKVVEKSLGELLDSGWQIIGHSSHRAVIAPYTNGASDESTFSYILHKNGKYINCIVENPRPDNSYSACRQMN